ELPLSGLERAARQGRERKALGVGVLPQREVVELDARGVIDSDVGLPSASIRVIDVEIAGPPVESQRRRPGGRERCQGDNPAVDLTLPGARQRIAIDVPAANIDQ